jgi:alkylation response protein AidB-like acyl-CoA dehydrogenase
LFIDVIPFVVFSAPVMNFGSEELKRKVIPPVLAGEKYIALAISEAFAGSDVANLRTTAVKTPDGKHYIVNGTKVRGFYTVLRH